MSNVRKEAVNAAYNKAYALISNEDMHIRFKSLKQFIIDDKELTEDEKSEAIKRFDDDYDYFKVVKNDGTRRTCENCQGKCLATSYCELCIRKYLKKNSSNWTSGNKTIDDLIRKRQEESLTPYMIVEWIPYDNFQNIKDLANGYSKIYSANWIDGCYKEWDTKEEQLRRSETCEVVLKGLEHIENANRSWIEEATTYLFISNKWGGVVQCYGLTKDPSSENFMLAMRKMDTNLRNYLIENRGQISWKTKIKIIFEIIKAVYRVHKEKSIHRNLHSGNVLFTREKNDWYISDIGFCGPADKPLNSVYGNLPYLAPEIIAKNEYSFASDVYAIGMLIWEITFEQPPFSDFNHDYELALSIVNGMRPKIVSEIPLEINELMEKCWDADPKKRPNTKTLWKKVEEFNKSLHENNDYWNNINFSIIPNINVSSLYENSCSKLFTFQDMQNTSKP